MTMQHFVNGFLFSADRTRVALIHKNRPAWQAGRINGIGGKVEAGEENIDAMAREFAEEAGVTLPPEAWHPFATLGGEGFVIHFYRAFSDRIDEARTVETEEVAIYPVDDLPKEVLHNLRWLIPMALDEKIDLREPVQIAEL
jgi:8-oxo-dGTP diphosphatase